MVLLSGRLESEDKKKEVESILLPLSRSDVSKFIYLTFVVGRHYTPVISR